MDAQQAGNLGHRLALCFDELAGMSDLLGTQGGAWPKAHTTRLSRDPAGTGALHDQGPLEISHVSEHGQHHAPGWRRGIGPRLGEQAQTRAGPAAQCPSPAGR